jgi:hypothetical protein
MSWPRHDEQRTRFRPLPPGRCRHGLQGRPWGPARFSSAGFWPSPASTRATFARLSAEELREEPGDRFVALVSRHLPALLHHRGLVAAGLVLFWLPSWWRPPPCGEVRSGAATCSRPAWHLLLPLRPAPRGHIRMARSAW